MFRMGAAPDPSDLTCIALSLGGSVTVRRVAASTAERRSNLIASERSDDGWYSDERASGYQLQ